MRVDVYWNLHKDCYSVRSREPQTRGRVVSHCESIAVRNPEFVVQPSGHERAVETGAKNVHAFIRGETVNRNWFGLAASKYALDVTYRPDVADYFFIPETCGPIAVKSAEIAFGLPEATVKACLSEADLQTCVESIPKARRFRVELDPFLKHTPVLP